MHFSEDYRIPIQISLNFVPRNPINNKTALVQVMAMRQNGDKPLAEPRKYFALGGYELSARPGTILTYHQVCDHGQITFKFEYKYKYKFRFSYVGISKCLLRMFCNFGRTCGKTFSSPYMILRSCLLFEQNITHH